MGGGLCRAEVPELSLFHAGLAWEQQQTAEVKVTARAAADLLRPVMCSFGTIFYPDSNDERITILLLISTCVFAHR